MSCKFCGMDLNFDVKDLFGEENYKKLVLHVWQFHDETEFGIPIKDTLANGPVTRSEEE